MGKNCFSSGHVTGARLNETKGFISRSGYYSNQSPIVTTLCGCVCAIGLCLEQVGLGFGIGLGLHGPAFGQFSGFQFFHFSSGVYRMLSVLIASIGVHRIYRAHIASIARTSRPLRAHRIHRSYIASIVQREDAYQLLFRIIYRLCSYSVIQYFVLSSSCNHKYELLGRESNSKCD